MKIKKIKFSKSYTVIAKVAGINETYIPEKWKKFFTLKKILK